MTKNIYFFIGPESALIKTMPVMKELDERGIKFKIIASGQNDITKSELLKILGINKIDIVLHNGPIKQSPLGLFFWFMKALVKGSMQLRKEFKNLPEKNTFIILHGDTVSTLMGGLIGRLYGLKVIHLEAGYRSFNFFNPFPEEICRVWVSYLANMHFCPTLEGLSNIRKRKGKKICMGYNTIIDSLNIAVSQDKETDLSKKLAGKKYFIFILHRQENLYNKKLVKILANDLLSFNKEFICVFIMHKFTRIIFERMGLLEQLEKNTNIIVSPRLPYIEFMKLLDKCEFIMTDGGGNQQETFYLGKPCLILRKYIEGNEGVGKNMVLSKHDPKIIKDFFSSYKEYKKERIIPTISPSKIVADYITEAK
jgi:UDP-N-acetylglucosamine 2-epimerase (non-hydrolysing)